MTCVLPTVTSNNPSPAREMQVAVASRVLRARGGQTRGRREAISQWGWSVAEHGIAVELRGPDGRAQAISPRARAERLRARAVARWAATRTDLDRAAVAFDYARGAAAAAARGGVDPSAEVDRLIRALWAAGESLTRQLAETEDRHV